jgi:hypothetical protein
VSGIQRLPFVGSDHFPIQIDLCFQPEQRSDENVLETQESDDDEANERIERAVKDPKMDGEAIETLRTSP